MAPGGGHRSGAPAPDKSGFVLAVLLAALAGWVDAVGFIRWHGLFVSFMSGNSTKAVAMAGADWSTTVQAARAIVVFVVGVVVGELLCTVGQRKARPLVLAVEAATLWAAAAGDYLGYGEILVASLLGAAMGLQNASVHHADGISVALTYVTGTLVHIGRGIAKAVTGHEDWRESLHYLSLWFGLVVGGLGGALVARSSGLVAMVLAAGAVTAFAVVTLLIGRPENRE